MIVYKNTYKSVKIKYLPSSNSQNKIHLDKNKNKKAKKGQNTGNSNSERQRVRHQGNTKRRPLVVSADKIRAS